MWILQDKSTNLRGDNNVNLIRNRRQDYEQETLIATLSCSTIKFFSSSNQKGTTELYHISDITVH